MNAISKLAIYLCLAFAGPFSAGCRQPERETDRLTGTETVEGRTKVYSSDGTVQAAGEEDDYRRTVQADGVMHRLDPFEREFMEKLVKESVGGMLLAGLAREKSDNSAILEIAESLHQLHARNLEGARALAMKRIPDAEIQDDERKLYDRLSTLKGSEFDRVYVESSVERLEGQLERFRDVARISHDYLVEDFLADAIPQIEHNLRQVRELR
jgi:predicted outer membrane protein